MPGVFPYIRQTTCLRFNLSMNPYLELGAFDPFGHLNVILNATHCGPHLGKDGNVFGFGMIPGTCSNTGAPLYAVVVLDDLAFAGAVIPSRLVGVAGGCFIAVASASRQRIKAVQEIDPVALGEIEELLTTKGWRVHKAWQGPECAREMLVAGLRSAVAAQVEEPLFPVRRLARA